MAVAKSFMGPLCSLSNDFMRERHAGGKMIGCFCSGVPENSICAAAIPPVRMRTMGSKTEPVIPKWT